MQELRLKTSFNDIPKDFQILIARSRDHTLGTIHESLVIPRCHFG